MFLLRQWRWMRGWVRFEAEGGFPGRLLTLAARNHLPLWNTCRRGTLLGACCAAGDYRRLRPLARRCGLRLHLRERHGAAFVLRRYHTRAGLLAGLILYVVLLIVLSGRIWVIDIRGLDTANEQTLRTLLTAQGVAVGQRKTAVRPDEVQLAALRELPDISWLAVNLDGCIAEIEIKEMSTTETPAEPTDPSNLVATRDGRIVAMKITGGEATAQVGDAVAEGTLLASGITATAQETLIRRSAGIVLAETSRALTVEVPLFERLLLPTEEQQETLELQLFGLWVPLSDSVPPPVECRMERFDHTLTIGGIPLPLGIHLRRYTALAEQSVTRTPEQARALADERLAQEEAEVLADCELLERTVSVTTDADTLTLYAEYRCIENIAREIPILLGDTPLPAG